MVQFFLPPAPDPVGAGIQQLAQAVGGRLQEKFFPQEQSVLQQLLTRGGVAEAQDGAVSPEGGSLENVSIRDVISLVTSGRKSDQRAGQALLKTLEFQDKAAQAEKEAAAKPSIVETQELKELGEFAGKVDSTLSDIDRALDIVDDTSTGPFVGAATPKALFSENQQELVGIGSRLLTGGFSVLPRISNEFESFKSGQISLSNTPEINKRNLELQKKTVLLKKRTLDRLSDLQGKGLSQAQALRQTKKEFAEEDAQLAKEAKKLRPSAKNKKSEQKDSEIDKIMFG